MKFIRSLEGQLAVGLGVLLVVALLITVISSASKESSSTEKKEVAVNLEDHIRGAKSAKVTVVEFADFECPACAAYSAEVKKVLAKYPNDVALVFKHFPLTQIHRNAFLAAKYAEAAAVQGKFWEYHDILFANQKEWSGTLNAETFFIGYGRTLQLDLAKLEADSKLSTIEDKIKASFKEGVLLKVQGTPTFFVNGIKADNASLEASVDAAVSGGSR